ncbi:MAG: TolC family protein [Candidatus Theseobacter exili]|nr:TolC family protein [Candidatus Theseobacter exili]
MYLLRKNLFFVVFILLGIFFVSGCKTLEAPSTPYQEWSTSDLDELQKSSGDTWATLRARTLDTSKPLTLSVIMDIALQNNPSTKEAWHDARVAEALQKQAESKWYPQAGLTAELSRTKANSSVSTAVEIDKSDINPALEITYLLFDFGGRKAAIEQEVQRTLAANFLFNQAIQDVLLNVATAYYTYYSSQSTYEAASSDVNDAKTALDAAQERFKSGLVTKLDVLQSQSDYDNSLYSLEEAKGKIKTSKAQLAITMGFTADTDITIVEPSKNVPMDISEKDITSIIDDALEKRPDIAALRANVSASDAAVWTADSNLWPSFSLGASGQGDWHHNYNQIENGHDENYVAYLQVSWAVFDGFNNINVKRAAQEQVESDREKLVQAELSASADIWTKYYDFKTAQRKLEFSKAFSLHADESYKLAFEGYNAGLKSILDLLQAQSKLSEARSQLIDSEDELFIAFMNLVHATGSLHIEKDIK